MSIDSEFELEERRLRPGPADVTAVAVHGFHGRIPGIHEALRRQGAARTMDPDEELSPGQKEEVDRVRKSDRTCGIADDVLIEEHIDEWLR